MIRAQSMIVTYTCFDGSLEVLAFICTLRVSKVDIFSSKYVVTHRLKDAFMLQSIEDFLVEILILLSIQLPDQFTAETKCGQMSR